MTNKTCINARMIANEKDTTNRWVYLALYDRLNEDNSPVDGRRVCKAGRRLSQPTAHSGSKGSTFTVRMWTKPSNNLAKNVFLAEHPKTSFLAKKWCVDFFLGDNSHKTLTLPVDLAHLLPCPPRCHPKQVVCPNSENVYSMKRLFVQTLRVLVLWKCCLSKLWECFFCEKADCQNSENVCSLNPGRWASPSPIISATQSAELRTEGEGWYVQLQGAIFI